MLGSISRRWVPVVLSTMLVALMLLPAVASAQESPRFKSMAVSIWPEYDQSSVFVNYEGELADDTSLPAKLQFALPKGFQVNSACEIDESGTHAVVNFEELTGDTTGVSYATGKKSTHIEFYYGSFEGAGKRDLTYKVVAPAAADSLVVDIQQPLRTSGFTVSPVAKQAFSDKDGFKYHRFEYSNVSAGQTITFNISYEKADAKPSVDPQQAANPTATAAGGSDYALPLILIGLGMVSVAGFAFVRGRSPSRRHKPSPAVGGARRKPASRPVAGQGVPTAEAQFCTGCGARLRPSSAFCSACGKPARKRV